MKYYDWKAIKAYVKKHDPEHLAVGIREDYSNTYAVIYENGKWCHEAFKVGEGEVNITVNGIGGSSWGVPVIDVPEADEYIPCFYEVEPTAEEAEAAAYQRAWVLSGRL